ncbi:SDR family NAD(P)-dependent oxidoreductase [Paucibacter sp. B2R-40]|uniref:SDR family NAD(P)-dependent oxidoreductase n=1 Tax=Paucibacter sp. B2R-40 TaxID=2893554 RepID=UPI0021E50549|nr:SDR family NAD(P)-dependent oxidoreductase [Paucibacter sp. B2R-40]MCV2352993.1 SDR family NAD(P)-dependent oxidoreductase [Paucibacter sp. B2R-40]
MHSNTYLRTSAARPTQLWLVTGASSGLGRAIALQLAESGQQVIAWGRDAARLAELQASHPSIVATARHDLAKLEGLAPACVDMLRQWPALSGVIHCAGIQHELLLETPGYGAADIEAELLVNLAAPIELTRALLPHLQRQAGSHIVFVTSALAHVPKRRSATYNASKAGLSAFACSLRAQLRGRRVKVSELIPPLVDTPMTAGRGGKRKLAPAVVARSLLRALRSRRPPAQIWVGPARWLPWLLRLAPMTIKQVFLR